MLYQTRTYNPSAFFIKTCAGQPETGKNFVQTFISVDPMADKYLGISPYAYCMNNPLKYVDPTGMVVETTDEQSQQNIKNTLTKDEAKYVRFNKNGILDDKRLQKSKSTSENMTALKTLSSSKRTYKFGVTEKTHSGDNFYNNSPTDFFNGVCEMPGAKMDPSPDNNIWILVGSHLNEKDQAGVTAEEAYGHGYFYELQQLGNNVNPFHTYENRTTKEWIDEFQTFGYINSKIPTNIILENRITTVINQALKNYGNKKK